MGVENLWCLLQPSGTKITIDSLATRKLAVDASLWLVQFIKAMRTPNGEMIENCHLLGLFRRICKLLFYNIKPVFVFDGPPPKLKRKTLNQRKIRRQKSENDIKQLAERVFLNRLQMASISLSKKQLNKLQKQKKKKNTNHNNSARIQAIEPTQHNNLYNGMRNGFVFEENNANTSNNTDDDMAGGFFIDENNINHNNTDNDNDIEILNKPKKKSDKHEMSDSDEEDMIASRALQPRLDISDDNKSDMEDSMDPNLYKRLSEANQFHKFPKDVSKMTAQDIAQLPASMQYEIMSKRRELLRSKTRPEFFSAAGDPTQYASVQLKNFLKTSCLNQKIECLRKKTVQQFTQQLIADNNENDGTTKNVKVSRIASEGDKLFVIKEQKYSNNMYRFAWLDKQTKAKKIEYFKKKRRRKSKWSIGHNGSNYVARTLKIEMNKDLYVGKGLKSDIIFKHWSCPICKYLNLKQRIKCDICGIVRDEALKKWKCGQCTHINDGNVTHCKLCDNALVVNRESLDVVLCEGNDDYKYDDIEIDNDLWICNICHWKNSNLCNNCYSCQKTRDINEEKDNINDGDICALQVVMDNDEEVEEDMNNGNANEMEIIMDESESENDNDLILCAPKLMIDLNDTLDSNVSVETTDISPHKNTETSPTKSSQILEMASSNVESLLNVKNSLQNFYTMARLTQQSTVLEETNNNDSDIEIECNIQPLIISDDNNEIVHDQALELEVSEHESDDDIIAEMDIKPPGYNETPGNTLEIRIQSVSPSPSPLPASTATAATHLEQDDGNDNKVPDSFLFEIPTFEEVEQAEKLEIAQFNNAIPANDIASDYDEEDEKLIEISDPAKMSKTLAEVTANQRNANDNNNRNKPLRRPRARNKKRKLNDTDFISEQDNDAKKRKLNENDTVSVENSLQRLHNMENNLIEENILLGQYQANAIRNSEHVTPAMINECLHLLDMFGIPYITSPSEAEAQCAELNKLGLVDGIITDDSDVFLFGGKVIYKNLFHLNKYVEKYTDTLVQSKLGLTQNKLISIAMLLGSDYTDGIKGIGPVNGIEIIQTFCSDTDEDFNGLNEFKKWIYSTKADKKPKKKPGVAMQGYEEYMVLKNIWFKYKHRNSKKKWFVAQDFPEQEVIDTYLNPNVDKSDTKFEWGKPDINGLKIFCREKFEWDENTINLTLDPIDKIVQHGRGAVQSSILSFGDWVQPNKMIKSQRVQKAVKALLDEIQLKKEMDAQRLESS